MKRYLNITRTEAIWNPAADGFIVVIGIVNQLIPSKSSVDIYLLRTYRLFSSVE